jgi:hypothetical protein
LEHEGDGEPAGSLESLEMNTHHNKSLFARIGSAVDMLGSAVAAASAVQSGRVPQSRHLRMLGIDPAAFPSVGRI